MKSAYFVEKNKMEVREFPKAQLVKETDAIIKIVRPAYVVPIYGGSVGFLNVNLDQ